MDRPRLYSGENYLNLGCGPNVVVGMVNADFFGSIRFWRNRRQLEWLLDLRYPLNCNDSVFEGVFSEHVLEHLFIDEARALLSELFRVMKQGAVIRISVPDLGKYLKFCAGELEDHTETFTEKFSRRAQAIGNLTQNYLHRSVWDYEELKFCLEQVGFEQVERKAFGVSRDPKLCLDQEERAWESLYVEALKPTK
jgi:predicted SAM-dependent methyltransferase